MALAATLWLAGPGDAAAKAPPPDDTRAEAVVREALAEYQAKHYAKAAELFLEAFELSRRPTPLRNAAKASEQDGQLERALSHWSLYLTLEELGPEDRAEAREHILHVRAQLEARAARVEPPLVVSRAASSAVSRLPAYVGLGTGLVLGVAGAVLFGLGSRDLDDLDEALARTDAEGLIVGTTRSDAVRALSTANDRRLAGASLLGAGGVAVVFGAVWWLTHLDHGEADATPRSGPALAPTSGGALLLWEGGL